MDMEILPITGKNRPIDVKFVIPTKKYFGNTYQENVTKFLKSTLYFCSFSIEKKKLLSCFDT